MKKQSGLINEALLANQAYEQQLAVEGAEYKRMEDERELKERELKNNALRLWINEAFGIQTNSTANPCLVDGLWFERDTITLPDNDGEYRGWKTDPAHFLLWDCPKCGKKRRALSFPNVRPDDKYKYKYEALCKRHLGQYIKSVNTGRTRFAAQCPNCKDGEDEMPYYSCRYMDLRHIKITDPLNQTHKSIPSSQKEAETPPSPHRNSQRPLAHRKQTEGNVNWPKMWLTIVRGLTIVGTLIWAYSVFLIFQRYGVF